MSEAWATEVARYYDSNTRRFLLVGSGRGAGAIHRELWGPDVGTAREASAWVNRLVADEIAACVAVDARSASEATASSPVVLDFGCGVGGTLFHLAERFPGARLSGITVSPRQLEVARQLAEELGWAERCAFSLGDFQTADLGVRADAVVAVESFAHSASADAFLANAARHLRPGGRLILVDDFLAADPERLDARQRRHVTRLRQGWRVPALCTTEGLVAAAAPHGLEEEKLLDLTPFTRPGSRLRDRLVAAVSPLLAPLGLAAIPFWGNVIGGHALQVGLREGFVRHGLVVMRKPA